MDDTRHDTDIHSTRRIDFIDIARGIGIVFVVLGHNLWSKSLGSAVIFNFHMPLFFFLSGMFFLPRRMRTWKEIRHRCLSVVLHLPFFAVAACLVFLVEPDQLRLLSKRTMYLLFVHGEPWFDKPLWFFSSLAGVTFCFAMVSRLRPTGWNSVGKGAFLAACLVLSFAASKTPPAFRKLWSPAMLATIPFGLFWYGMGYFSRGTMDRLGRNRICAAPLLLLAATLFLALAFWADPATKPDLRTARMGSWLLFPRSLLGIAAVILAARAMSSGRVGTSIAFVGRNSVAFFALEFVTFPFVARALGAVVPGYHHFKVAERTDLWQSFLAVAVQLSVLAALAPIIMNALSRFKARTGLARPGPALVQPPPKEAT